MAYYAYDQYINKHYIHNKYNYDFCLVFAEALIKSHSYLQQTFG